MLGMSVAQWWRGNNIARARPQARTLMALFICRLHRPGWSVASPTICHEKPATRVRLGHLERSLSSLPNEFCALIEESRHTPLQRSSPRPGSQALQVVQLPGYPGGSA